MACSHLMPACSDGGQWFFHERTEGPPLPTHADIYWAKLLDGGKGIAALYAEWQPFIHSICPYEPPPDPLHCTLYYDRTVDLVYREAFQEIEGNTWEFTSKDLFVGDIGVVSITSLTEGQSDWYKND